MRIVEPSESLANPNVCTICEETPKPANEVVIDTQRVAHDAWSAITGQKYVCEKCSDEIAKLRGFISAGQAAAAVTAAGAAAAQLANVRARVEELATGIAEFVKHNGAGDVEIAVEKFVAHSPAAAAVVDKAEEVAKSYEDVFGAPEPVVEKPKKAASTASDVGSSAEA